VQIVNGDIVKLVPQVVDYVFRGCCAVPGQEVHVTERAVFGSRRRACDGKLYQALTFVAMPRPRSFSLSRAIRIVMWKEFFTA
jgi:hypothetical protein